MPRVECPHSGCKHNSSNIVGYGGECLHQGTVRLVAYDDDRYSDYCECRQFEARPFGDMMLREDLKNARKVVHLPGFGANRDTGVY